MSFLEKASGTFFRKIFTNFPPRTSRSILFLLSHPKKFQKKENPQTKIKKSPHEKKKKKEKKKSPDDFRDGDLAAFPKFDLYPRAGDFDFCIRTFFW
jgi:hypothetical protein